MADTNSDEFQIQVTARALVTKGEDLLLVSNDGLIWYTPGGRLQPEESLHDCIRREVHEETGLQVKAGDLVHVFEYWEAKHHRHKVECYFLAQLEAGELDQDWADLDGPVEQMRFFTPEEVQAEQHIYPEFLKRGQWRDGTEIYMGVER
ncbi:NUDIX domain-containing protein [Nocardia altamirensis]|uniref:NUDIX domain-containing protein n=1 Tax=Nocardia altamirensis TaxID=472158 RepID=UPI00084075C7|nr:NUDIX hydrolase [Nocardia altamirensis]